MVAAVGLATGEASGRGLTIATGSVTGGTSVIGGVVTLRRR